MSKRFDDLEKRVSAIERKLDSGKENAEAIVSSWESVLLEFAEKFGLGAKEVRKQIAKRRGQK